MPASIQFTDATGAAALVNTLTGPAGRFSAWTPAGSTFGDRAHALGDGVLHAFTFGDRYDASFVFPHLPRDQQPTLERLLRHLEAGGTVHVVTDDADAREYPTCQMIEGQRPTLEYDTQLREYRLNITLRNVAADPEPMLCLYD